MGGVIEEDDLPATIYGQCYCGITAELEECHRCEEWLCEYCKPMSFEDCTDCQCGITKES